MLTLPKRNIDVVKEYMRLAYSPKENKGRITVEHLCQDDAYFVAPTTFPGCESPQDYAESHSKIMAAVSDLKIDSYDVIFANGGLAVIAASRTTVSKRQARRLRGMRRRFSRWITARSRVGRKSGISSICGNSWDG
jgi:hypothetical protein